MKKLLLPFLLIVLSTGCVPKSELAKTQRELASLQEQIRVLEMQRVPRTEFEQAQATVATAQERAATLGQELAVAREQLAGTQALLVAAQEREKVAERRLAQPGTPRDEIVVSAGLVKGTYTLKDDLIVYSHDAQLNFSNGVSISSPTGLMLSDKDREIVAGDLVVETPRGTVPVAASASPVAEAKPENTPGRPAGTK